MCGSLQEEFVKSLVRPLLTDDAATVETIGADLKLALLMLKALDEASES